MASNPCAFPLPGETNEGSTCAPSEPGMTLRDYFAGQAIVGLIHHYHEERGISPNPFDTLSDCAYCYADAMLAAREKGGS